VIHKRKAPKEVAEVLRFISENMKLSGFSGKITPAVEEHALRLFRAGKLKRKPPELSRLALKVMQNWKPEETMTHQLICYLTNSERGLREIGEVDLADKIRERLPKVSERVRILLTEVGIRRIQDLDTGKVSGKEESAFRRSVKMKPRVSNIEWTRCERRIQDGLRELAELIGRYQTLATQRSGDSERKC
jgi:hypothetical protein